MKTMPTEEEKIHFTWRLTVDERVLSVVVLGRGGSSSDRGTSERDGHDVIFKRLSSGSTLSLTAAFHSPFCWDGISSSGLQPSLVRTVYFSAPVSGEHRLRSKWSLFAGWSCIFADLQSFYLMKSTHTFTRTHTQTHLYKSGRASALEFL